MYEIPVKTQKQYTVTVTGGFQDLDKILSLCAGKRVMVVADENSDRLYGEKVSELFSAEKLVIPAGESQKNGENFLMLINQLAKRGFQRGDFVLALGGGVVGDLSAFVASTYMRGIGLIAMPTTILSMVDSSVGGKTAIDLSYGKNLCGTFYQPTAVYINLQTASTLPEREVLNGYGEIIKYALLDERVTLGDLKKPLTEELIYKCICIKRDIVEEDEFESGKRMLLNLGHTIGHAIEKLSNYTLSHGDCVVNGLMASVNISQKLFGLDNSTVEKMKEIVTAKGHDTRLIYSIEEIIKSIFADKKSVGDYVNFVALKGVNQPVIQKLKISDLIGLLG